MLKCLGEQIDACFDPLDSWDPPLAFWGVVENGGHVKKVYEQVFLSWMGFHELPRRGSQTRVHFRRAGGLPLTFPNRSESFCKWLWSTGYSSTTRHTLVIRLGCTRMKNCDHGFIQKADLTVLLSVFIKAVWLKIPSAVVKNVVLRKGIPNAPLPAWIWSDEVTCANINRNTVSET